MLRENTELVGLGVDDTPDVFYDKIDGLYAELGATADGEVGGPPLESRKLMRLEQAVGEGYAQTTEPELEFIARAARATGIVHPSLTSAPSTCPHLATPRAGAGPVLLGQSRARHGEGPAGPAVQDRPVHPHRRDARSLRQSGAARAGPQEGSGAEVGARAPVIVRVAMDGPMPRAHAADVSGRNEARIARPRAQRPLRCGRFVGKGLTRWRAGRAPAGERVQLGREAAGVKGRGAARRSAMSSTFLRCLVFGVS